LTLLIFIMNLPAISRLILRQFLREIMESFCELYKSPKIFIMTNEAESVEYISFQWSLSKYRKKVRKSSLY